MATSHRAQPALTIPTPASIAASSDLPPISALFLIDFDVKAGYTIVWKQAVDDVELDGRVEYKSLPSGLHTVSEDLIYFVHEGTHAGLSAFINVPCEEEEARNARMMAVGVLVPLSYGRLGRSWRHAEGLKSMAAYVLLAIQIRHSILLTVLEPSQKTAKKPRSSTSTGRPTSLSLRSDPVNYPPPRLLLAQLASLSRR